MPAVRVLVVLSCLSCLLCPAGAAQQPDRAHQIAAAVLPLPAELQAAAGVVALDGHGQPQVWRASANGMICLADSPGDSTFDVRCYQAELIDAWQSIHMPYRTAASMGLSTTEDGIHPYVMASGTFWAHVMIMQRPLRY